MKRNMKPESTTKIPLAHASCRAFGVQVRRIRRAIESEFGTLRDAQERLVNLALNEAEALACQTRYPHLVFPTLAEERLSALADWQTRQESLRSRERVLAFAA